MTIDKGNELETLLQFLGVENMDTRALSEVTYLTCLKLLSESLGKLPLKVMRSQPGKGTKEATDHSLYTLLRTRPNRYMSSTVFWSTMELNRNHYGNAYAGIIGAGSKTQLVILDPDSVQIWYDDACIISDIPDIYYLYHKGGHSYKFGSEEIIHVKTSVTFDGIIGKAVKDILKSTVTGNIKSQNMLNKLYDNGFTAKAVIQYTGELTDANAKLLMKQLEQYAQGKVSDVNNFIPLPLGTSLQTISTKLVDNQFLEIKKYSALQIASAFGIKPTQINDYSKSSYANAEAQQLAFLVDTLLYIIKQYEEELTYKLLSDDEINKGYKIKFNVNVILRADSKTQMEYLRSGVSNFIFQPNDAREQLDLPHDPNGYDLIGNGSTVRLKDIGKQPVNPSQGGEKNEDD